MTVSELCTMAMHYLKKNENRFNEQEKKQFMKDLLDWVETRSDTIVDEVYDFLVNLGITPAKTREEEFVSYLNKKYKNLKFGRVLDVGAGRMCKLSQALVKYGNEMYAIDPNIRLLQLEARKMGIAIKKDKFACDEYAKRRMGTLVDRYDHIIGLEPCDATEHIIRQSLKYDKPFDILLCATPHDSLNGKKFNSYEEWYVHLVKISSEVNINKIGSSYYASNEKPVEFGN